MDNKRYDYSPIIRRPKIEWHNHGRIALWVAPNIEYFHYNMAIRGTGSKKEKRCQELLLFARGKCFIASAR